MEKKIPMRTCIGCRNVRPKKDLIRIVKDKDGTITVDVLGKAQGRGTYICKNGECIKRAQKSKALSRTFKVQVPDDVYDNIFGPGST